MSDKIDIKKEAQKIIDELEEIEKPQRCILKITDGKAIVECPNAEAVAEATVAISKGVHITQVEVTVKPSVEKAEIKKKEKP